MANDQILIGIFRWYFSSNNHCFIFRWKTPFTNHSVWFPSRSKWVRMMVKSKTSKQHLLTNQKDPSIRLIFRYQKFAWYKSVYIIIIIMLHCWDGSPWASLTTISIVHHSWEVFQATSCIGTEVFYIGSSWSSYLCSSTWRGPQEYIACVHVFGQHFFINAYFIEQYKHVLSTYFVYVLSSCQIDFIVSGRNWLTKLP